MGLPFPTTGLYGVTPDSDNFDLLLSNLTQILRGGVKVVQLRDKKKRLSLDQCRLALQLCHAAQVPMIVNDDIALARNLRADGVHLGKEDCTIEQARSMLGDSAIVGVSCYDNLEAAVAAHDQGATYVAFGAFFPSSSKPEAAPAPLSVLRQAKQIIDCPLVAIGGITPDNGSNLLSAGADLLAVINGLFGQADPEAAAKRYCRLFEDR